MQKKPSEEAGIRVAHTSGTSALLVTPHFSRIYMKKEEASANKVPTCPVKRTLTSELGSALRM